MSKEILEILEFLQEEKISHVGIFTHQNADPDSISSAIGLKNLLLHFIPKLSIVLIADSLSKLSKKVLSHKDEEIFLENIPANLEAIFLCDTNNPSQLGNISLEQYIIQKTPIFIIDHHSFHEFSKKAKQTIIHDATSTAEIITQLHDELEIELSPEISTLLIAGILFDTRRFRYLSPNTLRITQSLIKRGGDYEKALKMLQTDLSISERVARLKGAARSIVHKEGANVYVVSYVNSFEASVARALIDVGASFSAVIAAPTCEEHRVSFRCTKEYSKSNDVNLGELANRLANKMNGSGGGHETAAGMNIVKSDIFPTDIEEKMKYLLDLLLEEIKR